MVDAAYGKIASFVHFFISIIIGYERTFYLLKKIPTYDKKNLNYII